MLYLTDKLLKFDYLLNVRERVDIIREATEHTYKANELLKQAQALRQLEKKGLFDKGTAMRGVMELNKQAADEIDKANELTKTYLEQQKDRRK